MQFRRQKTVKTLAIILLSLIAIVFGWLYFKVQPTLKENLSAFVLEKSEGKYELNYDDIHISFLRWGFEIANVTFQPSDSIIQSIHDSIPEKQLYSFSTPSIRINRIRLLKLIFRQELEIGEILVTQPGLSIHGKHSDDNSKNNNIESILHELSPWVSKVFKHIKINKIELTNASFDFYNLLGDSHKLSKGENITIGILNFYTDSLLLPYPDHLFRTDDVYLRMHNYQNKLGDSIHVLSAETVTFSLKKLQIEAENIELMPNRQIGSLNSTYQVLIPKALIKSRNIHEFYKTEVIPIDSVVLTGAKIKSWPSQKRQLTTLDKIVDYDLYPLISDEFSGISITTFTIDEAQLMLYRNLSDTESQQELKNIRIHLEDFLLDSISSQDTSRIFYSKNIDVSASEYELTLGDQIHRLKVGELELSTKNKAVYIENIQLYPVINDQTRSLQMNTIDASCDSVSLDLFDFKKAWHSQRFYLQSINLFNPEVRLTQNEAAENQQKQEDSSLVYKLISNYLKGIYSDRVNVQKGKFQVANKTGLLQRGLIETSFKLFLSGFALDEISARRSDRLFFANQIELNFSNYQMQLVDQLHKLKVENFSLSTQQKRASLQNLHLFPVSMEDLEERLVQFNRSELYEFHIPELSFTDAYFQEAFFNKKFHADLLTIKEPTIYYENFAFLKPSKPKADFEDLYLLLSNYLDDIRLEKVQIPDGTIQLINHSKKGKTISLDNQFSLGLETMVINKEQLGKKKLLFSEHIEFSVRDHLIRLSDDVHVIRAGTVGFSTLREEIYLTNAKMYPDTSSLNFPEINWNIHLAIPGIRIKGINIVDLYYDQKIAADNIIINSPQINLYQKNKKPDQTAFKEIAFPLPEEIESISIGQFNLVNAALKIYSELEEKPHLLVESGLKMESQNILIEKNNLTNKPEFIKGKYTAGLFKFRFTPKYQNQNIGIEELNFSTSERHILARQLTVKPQTRTSDQDQFEMRIPSLSMNGFDIDNAYRNYQYLFESILVEKPELTLYNNAKDSLQINPFNVNIYPHFESFADVFATNKLMVNDGDLTIIKNGKNTSQQKVSFSLTNFRIDDQPSEGFLHAADFSFKIQHIEQRDANNLYQFKIGTSEYSSIIERFTARNIQIVPTLSKEKFSEQSAFQSDYFSGKLDSIVITQPNIRRWFDKGELTGRNMSVMGLDIEIYRDKRLPFNEKQRPEMLQDIIRNLPHPIQIDSLNLMDGHINYTEQPPVGDESGTISFSHLNACLKPFTNRKGSDSTIPDFQLDATAFLMDSCQMKVRMHHLMNHPENLFKASGSLSPFNMRILNPVLEPLSLVSIRSGQVDQFSFNFSADKTMANGQLLFGYNDMSISVLELKNGNTKEAKFASFIANTLLLRSKNPRGKELTPDEISFQRDEKRSVLNYWWKSIFSGVRNTLGIKENNAESEDETDQ